MASCKQLESLDFEPLAGILSSISKVGRGDLIPILQAIQNEYGYLPRAVLMEMSRQTGIAVSSIYGVATFYEQFYLTPHGKHIVKCCRGTACHVRGAAGIAEEIGKILGIADGQTTEDMQFTFETVACLGTCALAPVMMIDGKYYGQMTPNRAKEILENLSSSREETV